LSFGIITISVANFQKVVILDKFRPTFQQNIDGKILCYRLETKNFYNDFNAIVGISHPGCIWLPKWRGQQMISCWFSKYFFTVRAKSNILLTANYFGGFS